MGCDIHIMLEYRSREPTQEGESHNWYTFSRDSINPGRDYEMFGYLAGVRVDTTPVVVPRGFPENPAWITKSRYGYFITDTGPRECGERHYCTKEKAEEWLKSGASKRIDDSYISGPDWHHVSWLTWDEFAVVLARYRLETEYIIGVEWKALTAAFKSLNETNDARIVFWFDN